MIYPKNVSKLELFTSIYKPKLSHLNKKQIIVFYGPPCSGKTTISKLIAEKYNCHRISFDLLRFNYFDKTELFSEENNKQVLSLFQAQMEFLIKNNQSVICEGLFISDERKRILTNICSDVIFLYFTASLNKLLNRLNQRFLLGTNSEELYPETMSKKNLELFYSKSTPKSGNQYIFNTNHEEIEITLQKVQNIIATHNFSPK